MTDRWPPQSRLDRFGDSWFRSLEQLGRNETLAAGPTLVATHKAYRDSGGSFKALLVSLLSSESFLYCTVPVLAKNSP